MVEVVCGDCGHTWNYTGKFTPGKPYNYIKCSQCGSYDISEVNDD